MERKLNLSIVKDLCADNNMTVKQFCKEIEITEVGFYNAMKTNRTTSVILEKICNYFEIPIGILFGENNYEKQLQNLMIDFINCLKIDVSDNHLEVKYYKFKETLSEVEKDLDVNKFSGYADFYHGMNIELDSYKTKAIHLALVLSKDFEDFKDYLQRFGDEESAKKFFDIQDKIKAKRL